MNLSLHGVDVRAQVLGSFGAPTASFPATARAETGPAKGRTDSPKKVAAPQPSPQKTAKQQSAEKLSPLKMAARQQKASVQETS